MYQDYAICRQGYDWVIVPGLSEKDALDRAEEIMFGNKEGRERPYYVVGRRLHAYPILGAMHGGGSLLEACRRAGVRQGGEP